MKFLGWIFLFSSTMALAQQVIEPAPLSVHDEGGRKIVTRKEGDTEIKNVDKAEVVNPPAAVEITPPNDEVLNPATTKTTKKKKTAKKESKAKPVAEVKTEIRPEAKPQESSEALTSLPKSAKPAPNPIDGQLKLGPDTQTKAEVAVKEETKAQEKVIESSSSDTPVLTPIAIWEKEQRKYVQLAFGYIDSDYEKIHRNLDNGSSQLAFKFISDIDSNVQTGFAVELLADRSSQKVPDNIRLIQYRLFGEYHAPVTNLGSMRLDWVAGGAFSIGEYGIKRRYLNANNEEVSVKIKNGTILGLIPTAGLRFYLVGPYSLDIMVEYHQYFGNPQKYIGGIGVSPRLNFPF